MPKGRIVHGGDRLTGAVFGKGSFVAPTVVAELPSDHWINKEELFLPFLSVQACAWLDEGIVLGNRNVYGLCAGLCPENPKEIERFLGTAEAGVLYVNLARDRTENRYPLFPITRDPRALQIVLGASCCGALWGAPRFQRTGKKNHDPAAP